MDFRLTEEQELLRRTVREFADTEIRPHVREWDRDAAFSGRADAGARVARADGHSVPRGVRRRGDVRHRLLHLHRGAGPRRSRRRAVGGRPQRPVRVPYLPVRHRAAEADLSGAAGERREDWRLGSDRVDLRQRRRRHAHDGQPVGRVLGPQRRQDVHHPRPRRRRDGGDGDHRSRRRRQGHLRLHHREGHARHGPGQEGRQARHAGERDERGALRQLPDSRRSPAGRGGARVRRQHAGAGCRAHRHRRARRRAGAGRVRGGAEVCPGAQGVREDDQPLPGDPMEARRQRHADRSGAAADLPGGLPEGPPANG